MPEDVREEVVEEIVEEVEEPAEEEAEPAEVAAEAEPEEAAAEIEEIVDAESEPEPEPVVEAPAEEVADEAAYTDEDMAFAASLSDGIGSNDTNKKGGYVAPIVNPVNKPAKKDRGEGSEAASEEAKAPKGEKKMNENAIYKKPIAIIMMILSLLGAAISLLFINGDLFGLINAELGTKVAEIAAKVTDLLPGGTGLIPVIFGGVIVLIS